MKAILSRGYTICADFATGQVLKSTDAAVAAGDMQVMFVDGRLRATVKEKMDGRGQ